MGNHFHLLIREREESVGDTIKRIASSYVYYYNRKYGRDGHLFKERFKSEPVDDMAYFVTLLRYIHQNPVKAGMVMNVMDYAYSSWGEYTSAIEPVFQICDTATVLKRVPFCQLNDLVNEMLSDDVRCIDIEDPSRVRPSDDQAWQMIIEMVNVTNSSAFQKLDDELKRRVLKELKARGASHRQLERLTGVGRGLIQKL